MTRKHYTPNKDGHKIIQEVAEFLRDVGDERLQRGINAIVCGICRDIGGHHHFGESSARELLAALIVYNLIDYLIRSKKNGNTNDYRPNNQGQNP